MLTAETTFADVITEFLTEVQMALVAYLAENNRNATGASSASIQVANVTDTGGQVIGSPSIQWVFTGRGPGGFPPLSKIIDWLNARGLPRSIAWIVGKKISEQGTKLYREGGRDRNGVTETLTPDRIAEFNKNIANTLAVEISSGITNIWGK